MKYIDEFRDKDLVLRIAEKIHKLSTRPVSLMEVCGGHTMAIQRYGIPSLLPENISLLSGPGCPVCVSSRHFIDQAIAYSKLDNVIITTYGDLIMVPGSSSSLNREKAGGADIRIVYSVLDVLKLAQENKNKKIIFLAIGFETTAPSSAVAILNARRDNISNFFLYSAHKVMPPAMEALVDEGVMIDGYIAPGHVSTITGSQIYENIANKYKLGCVISGFEPVDLLQTIYMLVKQIETHSPKVEIQYKRAVKREGNVKAQQIMYEVFDLQDDWWRGLGILKNSGLKLRKKYKQFDTEKIFNVEVEKTREDKGCICGEILKGIKKPKECKLFGKICTPDEPVGPCMVSQEGACHAYFRYSR
ncbi:MAG: hydrogenase formation protein HypD [Bacteroidetes bacterium]|nr:hydrogenase formation protein HypD [Bacteroidota bacterium]